MATIIFESGHSANVALEQALEMAGTAVLDGEKVQIWQGMTPVMIWDGNKTR